MCISLPQRIIKIKNDHAVLENGEKASLGIKKAKKNDFVMVQDGFVVKVITKKEASKILKIIKNNIPHPRPLALRQVRRAGLTPPRGGGQ